MARSTFQWFLLFLVFLSSKTRADDRIHFPGDIEKQRNTPPKLTSVNEDRSNGAQPRFFPFAASFSLGSGSNNAHSVNIGGSNDGITLSQSSNLNAASSLSASQSSSFSAGLNGVSASDSNAFSSNHPLFGGSSQADSNSVSFGKANATSHGKVVNGQASSGAQSSAGSSHSPTPYGASSNAGNGVFVEPDVTSVQKKNVGSMRHFFFNRPSYQNRDTEIPTIHVHLGQRPSRPYPNLNIDVTRYNPYQGSWNSARPEVAVTNLRPNREKPSRNANCDRPGRPGCSEEVNFAPSQGPVFGPQRKPGGTRISAASASSGASSSANGFSFSQSLTQSNAGAQGPSSSTKNQVASSGNGQGHAQGSAAAVQQNNFGQAQASFSVGAINGNSGGDGDFLGTSDSSNRGESSKSEVNGASSGGGSVIGSANSGSAEFPVPNYEQDIPREFVRSYSESGKKGSRRDSLGRLISDITDSVADLFDIGNL